MAEPVGELFLQSGFDRSVSLFGEVPARTAFSPLLLERADPACLTVEGDLVTITLVDRVLTYRVLSRDLVTGIVEAELVPNDGGRP